MSIDAHQHFWKYSREEYPWIREGTPLQRDWLPSDLETVASPLGIKGTVAVQARQTFAESQWLLELANESDLIKGVVGWVDLRSESVEAELRLLAPNPKFVGARHVVQDEPDSQFMLGAEFRRGISKLKQFDLAYDLLLFPKQLPAAVKLSREFPDQPFVLDHAAKPLIRAGLLKPWREDLRELAANPNVYCKLSGLITEANCPGWAAADFRPYLDIAYEAFGENRLMFGSDWPVCLLGASYADALGLVAEYFRQFSDDAQRKFFGGNAAEFYGLAA